MSPTKPLSRKLKVVLESGWYILGNEVREFESSFAIIASKNFVLGREMVLMLSSDFKAYIMLGKPKKETKLLFQPPISLVFSILQADLVPVLVEPKLETYNIDPNLISQKNFKTKSILAVHLYGQLAEMEVNEIALQMIL
jgi:dTDP-4-amino-4,6-dideoxygalactose transaminase